MGYYKYVNSLYEGLRKKIKEPENRDLKDLVLNRKKEFRKSLPVVRLERPTRIDNARKYGYKAKQGFVVARVRIGRGPLSKSRPLRGRSPGRMGVNRIYPEKSMQRIAEERANRKFPNLEVLGSYWLLEDGRYKWYEIVMVDPNHSVIKSDKDVSWICEKQHRKRALRGLTPVGRKSRGLYKKGKGTEKIRPSIKAHRRRGK